MQQHQEPTWQEVSKEITTAVSQNKVAVILFIILIIIIKHI